MGLNSVSYQAIKSYNELHDDIKHLNRNNFKPILKNDP